MLVFVVVVGWRHCCVTQLLPTASSEQASRLLYPHLFIVKTVSILLLQAGTIAALAQLLPTASSEQACRLLDNALPVLAAPGLQPTAWLHATLGPASPTGMLGVLPAAVPPAVRDLLVAATSIFQPTHASSSLALMGFCVHQTFNSLVEAVVRSSKLQAQIGASATGRAASASLPPDRQVMANRCFHHASMHVQRVMARMDSCGMGPSVLQDPSSVHCVGLPPAKEQLSLPPALDHLGLPLAGKQLGQQQLKVRRSWAAAWLFLREAARCVAALQASGCDCTSLHALLLSLLGMVCRPPLLVQPQTEPCQPKVLLSAATGVAACSTMLWLTQQAVPAPGGLQPPSPPPPPPQDKTQSAASNVARPPPLPHFPPPLPAPSVLAARTGLGFTLGEALEAVHTALRPLLTPLPVSPLEEHLDEQGHSRRFGQHSSAAATSAGVAPAGSSCGAMLRLAAAQMVEDHVAAAGLGSCEEETAFPF